MIGKVFPRQNLNDYFRKHESFRFFLFFLFFNAVVLLPISVGLNYSWDWNFPIFRDDIPNFFWKFAFSWNEYNYGQSLSYASDYFFRFFVYLQSLLLPYIEPEQILFFNIVLLFSLTQFYFWRSFRVIFEHRKDGGLFLFVLSLAIVYNPFVFIKLFAGHLNYLVSLSTFSALIFLLLSLWKDYSAKTLACTLLVFAFSGAQIQFFPFNALVIFLFYLFFFPRKFLDLVLYPLVAIVINFPWLVGFISDFGQLSSVMEKAKADSFTSLSQIPLLDIFSFHFGNFYRLGDYFPAWYLYGFFFLALFAYIPFLKSRKKYTARDSRLFLFFSLLSFLGVFFSLGTMGPFAYVKEVLYSNGLFSIFRESAHFLVMYVFPLFFLFGLSVFFICKSHIKAIPISFLTILIFGSIFVFYTRLPIIKYSDIRSIYADSFGDFLTSRDGGTVRFAQYPSVAPFDPVTLDDFKGIGGWNPSAKFSKRDLLYEGYAAGSPDEENDLLLSIQRGEINSNVLSKYNVGYIVDFSKIHQSIFDKYVPESVYGKKTFYTENKLAKNLGHTDNQIYDYSSDIPGLLYARSSKDGSSRPIIFERVSPVKYRVQIQGGYDDLELIFLDKFSSSFKLYADWESVSCPDAKEYPASGSKECVSNNDYEYDFSDMKFLFQDSIFSDSHELYDEYANSWSINLSELKTPRSDAENLSIVIYFLPQSYMYVALLISCVTFISLVLFIFIKK